MKRLLLPALALLLLATGCSDGVEWSGRERENGEYLLAALQFTNEAATIANSIETTADLDAKREPLLRALRAAQWNAAQVDDQVLDKLHPALYGRFRIAYRDALGDMIEAYERNDIDAAERAAHRLSQFIRWYQAERHTFRWWPDATRRN
ncbi:MAG TPA: hypothetical protein VKZ99_09580 [Gammaproteobacteria bacterium]|nr:hypothetical protein [Gammaproteobacteria bacterium]